MVTNRKTTPRARPRVRSPEDGFRAAALLFRALGHDGRLRILSHLADSERSVSELEELLGQRQAAVSQQLARLRKDRLVAAQRKGKSIIYRLADGPACDCVRSILQICSIAPGRDQVE